MTECSTDGERRSPNLDDVFELKESMNEALKSGMNVALQKQRDGEGESDLMLMGFVSLAAEITHILLGSLVSISESQRTIAEATNVIADEAEMTMKDVQGQEPEEQKDWRDNIM